MQSSLDGDAVAKAIQLQIQKGMKAIERTSTSGIRRPVNIPSAYTRPHLYVRAHSLPRSFSEKCWAEIQACGREFQEMIRGASQDYTECLVCQAIAKDTAIDIEEALKRVCILKRQVSTLLDDILENNGCGKLWSKGHIIYLNLEVFVQRLENILGFALGGIDDLQRKYRSKSLMYQN